MSLGSIIKRAREGGNPPMSVPQAAAKLGITPGGLRLIEADERRPGYETIARMIEVFKLDPRLLFDPDWKYVTDRMSGFQIMCRELGLTSLLSSQLCAEISDNLRDPSTRSIPVYFKREQEQFNF